MFLRCRGIKNSLFILIRHGPGFGLRLEHLLLLLMLYALTFLFLLAQKHSFLLFKHLQHNIRIALDPLCFRQDYARFLIKVLDGVSETDF